MSASLLSLNVTNRKMDIKFLIIPAVVVVLVLFGIQPRNESPRADFMVIVQAEDGVLREGLSASFHDRSEDPEGKDLVYRWSFGDGSESEERNPSYTYEREGDYEVSLTAEDPAGNRDTKNQYVSVFRALPEATFDIQPFSPKTNSEVTFTDRSYHPTSGVIEKREWVFDKAHEENVVICQRGVIKEHHVYSRPGTYTVKLTVYDDRGESAVCTREIVVSDVSTILEDLEAAISSLQNSIDKLELQVERLGIAMGGIDNKIDTLESNVQRAFSDVRFWLPMVIAVLSIVFSLVFGIPAYRRTTK